MNRCGQVIKFPASKKCSKHRKLLNFSVSNLDAVKWHMKPLPHSSQRFSAHPEAASESCKRSSQSVRKSLLCHNLLQSQYFVLCVDKQAITTRSICNHLFRVCVLGNLTMFVYLSSVL